jgi:hypothetical protein
MTVKILPATVNVPALGVEALPIENVTVRVPVPAAPPVTAMNASFEAAVHAQVDADGVTVTEPVPPARPMVDLVALSV